MMEKTIGVETVDYWKSRRSTWTPYIFACTLLKVKNHKGSYDRKAKKFKKVKQEYKKQRFTNFKTCNQWTRIFCKCTLGLFLCNDFFSNINSRMLLMHKYCNHLVTQFFTIFDRYTIYCIPIALNLFSSVLVRLCCHCLCLLYDYLKYIYFCILCIQI